MSWWSGKRVRDSQTENGQLALGTEQRSCDRPPADTSPATAHNWKADRPYERTPKHTAEIDGFSVWAEDDGDWHVFCHWNGFHIMASNNGGRYGSRGRMDQAKANALRAIGDLKAIGAKGR